MLGGAAIGAATAGKDKKKGALKGALFGLTLGGASALPGMLGAKGAAATTTTGGKLASSKALTDAMAAGKAASVPVVESTSAAALKAGAPTTAAKAQTANQLNSIALQQQQNSILDAVAQSGGQMSLTPKSIATLQQGGGMGGAFSPATGASQSTLLNAYNAGPGALSGNQLTAATLDKTLQGSAKSLAAAEPAGMGSKLLTTVKEKPLETAFMMSMLGGGGGQGSYAVSGGGGPTYGGQQQVQPYAPAEDRLIAAGGKSDGTPEFIPKGNFEVSQAMKEEEYMRMMNRGMI
jgi:hypothetical protein